MLLYGECEVNSVVCDSRLAAPGCVFVCLTGARRDGHEFARDVYDRGCRAIVCQRSLDLPSDCRQFVVADTRRELALLAAQFYGYPAKELKIVGVTGTKGKTSTSTYLSDALNRAGHKAGFIGTTGTVIDGVHTPNLNSTPESLELHRIFRVMADAGCEYAVMEVSSQAYKLERVYGLTFEAGIFTNLSPDHISPVEHENFEDYRDCKARLFENSRMAAVNADDAHGEYMAARCSGKVIRYGIDRPCDLRGRDIHLWKRGQTLGVDYTCDAAGESFGVEVATPGVFSVYNSLAVLSALTLLGVDRRFGAEALKNGTVRGRFEIVPDMPRGTFIIDYAHNELSLSSALETLRAYDPQRLICLFGSIGGRAALRRESMGRVAAKLCDFIIITSDNPDNENPPDIMNDIERGIDESGYKTEHVKIADRAEAIDYAVKNAREGDVILLAGKGHEDYQIIAGKHVHFSELECLRASAQKYR